MRCSQRVLSAETSECNRLAVRMYENDQGEELKVVHHFKIGGYRN